MRTRRTTTPGAHVRRGLLRATGRVMLSQVRAQWWPALGRTRAAGRRRCRASSSSLVRDRSRSPAMSAATSEVQANSAAASASASGKAGSTTTRRSLRPAARSWTLAQATSDAVGRLDDDLAAGPRADPDHLSLHEVGVDGTVRRRQRAPEVDERDQGRNVAGERLARSGRAGARDAGWPAARRGDGPPGHRSTPASASHHPLHHEVVVERDHVGGEAGRRSPTRSRPSAAAGVVVAARTASVSESPATVTA